MARNSVSRIASKQFRPTASESLLAKVRRRGHPLPVIRTKSDVFEGHDSTLGNEIKGRVSDGDFGSMAHDTAGNVINCSRLFHTAAAP